MSNMSTSDQLAQKKLYLAWRQNTCPSAIINKTWYWPPLSSTMVIAISIIGANEVGPATSNSCIKSKNQVCRYKKYLKLEQRIGEVKKNFISK